MTGHGRWRTDESGLTLAEMLVTVTVLAVVLSMATASAFTLFGVSDRIVERNVNADQSRFVVAVTSRAVRAAVPPPTLGTTTPPPAFEVAAPQRAVLFTRLRETDPTAPVEQRVVPVKVTLEVNTARQLIETVVQPVTAADGAVTYPGAGARRVVAEHVVNRVGAGGLPVTPMFTYLRENGTTLPANPTAAQRGEIRAVRVTSLTSRDGGTTTPPQRVTTDVRVVNALIADRAEDDA